MQKPQLEIVCLICGKRVTPQEDTCVDENGKVVHTDCHAQQILSPLRRRLVIKRLSSATH
jgi:predicted nucleic acid-binding Zn ribbon protein